MQTEDREVTVTGQGETLQRAFQEALNAMRKRLLTGRREALLKAEPEEAEVVEAVKAVWTERFFGIFFARQRQQYRLTVRFRVRVSFVDLDAIDITEVDGGLRFAQRLLQLK